MDSTPRLAEPFVDLVERHHGSLVRLAGMFVSTRSSAEEVAQETWLAALDSIERFEGRCSLKTWLFRIAANLAKTRAVKEGRSIPFSTLGAASPEDGEASETEGRFDAKGRWVSPPAAWRIDTPEDLLAQGEAARALAAALHELPPSHRAVVTMRDWEAQSSEEVCEILEISDANQRVLLHRARAGLRRALERHFRRADAESAGDQLARRAAPTPAAGSP